MTWTPKARVFWPLFLALVLADCTTKDLAERHLAPAHVPHQVIGNAVRLTLTYNPGAAMSLSLGPHSRVGFSLLTILALAVLGGVYRGTAPQSRIRGAAIALVAGGAAGNLLDRLQSGRGVVDFIDVGLGSLRFWTFNLADTGITCGTILLAFSLLWERPRAEGGEAPAGGGTAP